MVSDSGHFAQVGMRTGAPRIGDGAPARSNPLPIQLQLNTVGARGTGDKDEPSTIELAARTSRVTPSSCSALLYYRSRYRYFLNVQVRPALTNVTNLPRRAVGRKLHCTCPRRPWHLVHYFIVQAVATLETEPMQGTAR